MLLFAIAGSVLGDLLPVAAILIIMLAVWGILRGLDVRLCLLVAAFALAGFAGDMRPVLRVFLATFSNEKFVVPICTAMGFAYVLRHTEADQHLVHLLAKPLHRTRHLLIPGVVCIGFFVNIPVISQTSTAVCLGAVVVPLLRSAGLSPTTIGASILLGASLGGELLNPAAPELLTVKGCLNLGSTQEMVKEIMPLVIPHLLIATLLFWWLTWWSERNGQLPPIATDSTPPVGETLPVFRVNFLLALVPLVPLIILFLTGEPIRLLRVPESWVVDDKAKSAYDTRLIGAAMLVGVLVAALARPSKARSIPKAFFDGGGYAFANVVSLIVTANCFGKAIEQVGLAQGIGQIVRSAPGMLLPLAGSIPLLFGAISGSGMASTQSLYGLFAGPGCPIHVDGNTASPETIEAGKRLGAIVSIAAAAGRTMSPVAAVTLMCASMTNVSPFTLAKRVALPLLVSWVIVMGLRMMGVL